MKKIFECVEEMIGNTPLVRLKRIEEAEGLSAKLYAKTECFNPSGSAKDRAAKVMIEEAEKAGLLQKGGLVVEPTSGNTGIAMAMLCAAKGYKAVVVMPETMSVERQKLMRAYGAEVVLTDGAKGMDGAIEKAKELVKTKNAFMLGQFENPDNPKAHYLTTGPEIFEALDGEVDIFVCAVGTGGTLTGTARYLKEKLPCLKAVGVEPKNSPVLSGGKKGAHKIQGIGAGFVPEALDTTLLDEVVCVSDEDAYLWQAKLVRTEGLFCGFSSGAALKAAIEQAKRKENEGKNIVLILPDDGGRYLSNL